jgi:hypothetical protein
MRSCNCAVTEWPHCKQILSGQKNIANDPVVYPQKIVLSMSCKAWTDEKFCEGHKVEWRRFSVSATVSTDQQCKDKRRDLC